MLIYDAEIELGIEFKLFDDLSITVTELQLEFETTAFNYWFSWKDIKASVSTLFFTLYFTPTLTTQCAQREKIFSSLRSNC